MLLRYAIRLTMKAICIASAFFDLIVPGDLLNVITHMNHWRPNK